MSIKVCIAGVTGWTGKSVAEAVLESDDFELVGAVARSSAGMPLSEALGYSLASDIIIMSEVRDALKVSTDVLIDYTHPTSVKQHVLSAIESGSAAVIGTSGLMANDFQEINEEAQKRQVGVISAGNFSITAALLKHFSGIAAKYIPHWEIIDMASAGKPDAPSGTAQELSEYLGEVAHNELTVAISDTIGSVNARGATVGGAQVHSLRLPSYVLSVESVFGLPEERLSIRHDAGSSAQPYVGGTLLAAKEAPERVGLIRGLDTLLFS
tara:strand:+ start:649 stop:1452 length:804 start_codon:yes stop_codon:yes gene_type:complete